MSPLPFPQPTRTAAVVRLVAAVTIIGLGAVACTSNGAAPPATTVAVATTLAGAVPPVRPDASSMQGVCPNPVVIQLAGPPDMWALPYVGAAAVDGTVTAPGRYTAALLDPRSVTPTGISIELRTAAALPAGQTVSQAMQADPSILLGEVGTVEALASVTTAPTVAVLAPWERADVAFTWDGTLQPDAITIADFDARLDSPPDIPLVRYLVNSGLVARTDGSVRTTIGTRPTTDVRIVRMLADPATIAMVGEGPDGARAQADAAPAGAVGANPVAANPVTASPVTASTSYALVDETGWEPYEHSLATTPGNVTQRASCLRALVPLLQHAAVRVSREPDRLIANLAVIAAKLGVPTDINAVGAAIRAARAIGVLGNGPNGTLGDLDLARVQQMVRAQIISENVSGVRIPAAANVSARASAIVDRSFTDSTIGIGRPLSSVTTPTTTRAPGGTTP